jgi:hypothetical protein
VHETGREIEALARSDRARAGSRLTQLEARRDSLLAALEVLRHEVLCSAS